MNGVDTIKLLGEKRIKTVAFSMILLIPCLLFFSTLGIYFEIKRNYTIIYIILYLLMGLLFIIDIYILINTYKKLIFGTLFVGLSFMVISTLIYVIFSFIVSKGNTHYLFCYLVLYILYCSVVEIILVKTKYYNFRGKGNVGKSSLWYILGAGIGTGGYEYIKNVYGKAASEIIGVVSLLFIATLFSFLGVFYINKYIFARRYEAWINIFYEE